MTIVVYTASIGRQIGMPQIQTYPNCEFVCISDFASESGNWKVVSPIFKHSNRIKVARWYKTHPHILFGDADWTIWMDDWFVPINIYGLVELAKDGDIGIYKHRHRDCIYEEAEVCIKMGLDDANIIKKQMGQYRRESYPSNFGLHETCIIVRRNTPSINELNEEWWNQIECGSHRDQLSFDFVVWKMGINLISLYPGDGYNNPYFKKDLARKKKFKSLRKILHE